MSNIPLSNAPLIVKILMLTIGFVIGIIFLFVHFWYIKTRRRNHFSHDNKSETILGHLKKYYFLFVSICFFVVGISGLFAIISPYLHLG